MTELHYTVLDAHLEEARAFILSQKSKFPHLNVANVIDTLALTYFAVKGLCQIEPLDVIDCITEGGGDNMIDAIYLEDSEDDLVINVFQTKFKKTFAPGFDKNTIAQFVDRLTQLENGTPFEKPNARLQLKWDEIKDACKGKKNFSFKLYLITNGEKPKTDLLTPLDALVDAPDSNHAFELLGVKELFALTRDTIKKQHTIKVRTRGTKLLVESIGNIKAFVCNLPVNELIEIYDKCGKDDVLQSNIRHYLGKRNKVNTSIRNTALVKKDAEYFWFQNNGISIVCDKLKETLDPNGQRIITIENPVIVNGGQTTRTLYELRQEKLTSNFPEMFIIVRLFETSSEEIINKITKSTNSQSPIFFRDLESNNKTQGLIKSALKAKKIYLETKRNEYDGQKVDKARIIKNDTLLQYYVSIFKAAPSEAKQSKSKTFESYFDKVFVTTDKKLPDNVYKAYLIYEFIKRKEAEKPDGYLRHANLAIAYLLSKYIEPADCDVSVLQTNLEYAYKKARSIIAKIVVEERKRLGDDYSHNNLFKSREIVILMEKRFKKAPVLKKKKKKKLHVG